MSMSSGILYELCSRLVKIRPWERPSESDNETNQSTVFCMFWLIK